jgi:hypothetical protein
MCFDCSRKNNDDKMELRLEDCHSEAQANRWVNRRADKIARRLLIAGALAWATLAVLVFVEWVMRILGR